MTHIDARHATCIICKFVWNIARKQRIPMGGYVCPHCARRLP